MLESRAFAQGTWCSGITPAQHAGGPGFNPQRVHILYSHRLCLLRVAICRAFFQNSSHDSSAGREWLAEGASATAASARMA
jgi:hypothetical protein